MSVINGVVKWYNIDKGYGFIQPVDGARDAFVHATALRRAGIDELREGDAVQYQLVKGKSGKMNADNLKLLNK